MKRLLVTGAEGLLGRQVMRLTQGLYEVIPTDIKLTSPNLVKMDVTDTKAVTTVIRRFEPNVVVHTAAQTDVDRCETFPEEAWRINAEGTKNVAHACKDVDAKLVYLSTDYVFDGVKGLYDEEDQPNPINHYGVTKLRGEEYVKEQCANHAILRTSVLYGWHPEKLNYVTWVIDSLRASKVITVVTDHYNSPTLAENLAQAILKAVEKDVVGTYHIAGAERIGRFNFAVRIAEAFNLDESLIKPMPISEASFWTAKRPRDSSLSVEKARRELGVRLLDISQGLAVMKEAEQC